MKMTLLSTVRKARQLWRRLALGKTLVLIQVAVSLPLLVGAGLFLRTLRNLEQVDYGFDANNLLLFNVNPSLNGYNGEALAHVYGQIADRIDIIPGVESTTISQYPLLNGSEWEIDGVKVPGAAGQPPEDAPILLLAVKDNFLDTMRIPLLAGRSLTARDTANASKVAVVSEAFAGLCFKDGDAVGHHIAFPVSKALSDLEIVGVARNARYDSLRGDPPAVAYLPFVQHIAGMETGMSFEVRSVGAQLLAKVSRRSPAADETTRTVHFEIDVANAGQALPVGATAQPRLPLS